jgi:hypothetical protein
MAITTTSTAAAVSASAQSFKATSATGATVGGVCKIDNEYAVVTGISGTQINLRRTGDNGGAVVAHGVLAPVQFGLPEDFPLAGATDPVPEPAHVNFLSIGADGVIPVPTRDTTYVIMKGSALASSTFADPGAGQNGLLVTFMGGTDFAHVVTTVNCFDGTQTANTVLTSAAFKGSSITLMAYNATWLVFNNNLWVITVP